MSISFLKSGPLRREACFLFGLIVVVLGTRIPFLMHGLDEWDTANFALSVVHFDVLGHQPHAPGQLVYVWLMQFINRFTGNELYTLSFASAVASTLALVPYYFALRQMFRAPVAMGAAILTAFTFGFWVTSLRMISDPVACLFVYGTVCALLAGLRDARWFVFGMALCGLALGVKQTAVYFLAPFAIAVNLVVLSRSGLRRPLLGSVLFAVAVLAWLLPTIQNCHGWTNYLTVCRALQRENYAVESIVFHLTANAAQVQGRHNFLQPWGASTLAAVMLVLAAGGLLLCFRRGLPRLLFALFGLTVVFYAFFFLFRFNKYFVYYVPVYCAFASAALFGAGEWLARWLRWPAVGLLAPGLTIAVVTAVSVSVTAPLLPKINHFRAPPQAALEALRKMPGVEAVPLLLTDDITTGRQLLYFHLKHQVDLLNRHPDLGDAVAALDAGRKVYLLSPVVFDAGPTAGRDGVRLLGRYEWRPELYEPLQGRPDLRQLSLYELTAPLPVAYAMSGPAPHPPLLLEGMWEDGWCGADARLVLPCDDAGPDFVHLQFTSREDFGFRYPYRMVCQFADGQRTDLTIAHAGRSDFSVALPDHPGSHTVQLRLLAPQTTQPWQLNPVNPDHRDLSVQLNDVECVTESRPFLSHRENGWYEQETDGQSQWRWTNGNATVSVLSARPGAVVMEGFARSVVDGNAVEVLVDGQPAVATPLPGPAWEALKWRLPVNAGLHLITLHSRLPGRQPPNDGRTLALCVRDFQTRFEP